MVERPHTGPLPPAHPVPYGRPPQPDGQTVPQPPAELAPLPRRAYVYAWSCVVIAVLAAIIGALR